MKKTFKTAIITLTLIATLILSTQTKAKTYLERYGDQNMARELSEGNPVIPGLFADPSIAKFGDTYYIYATTDGFGWPTGRWVVWKSKDFVNWSFKGESFPEITGKQNWAPGVPVYRNGKYWLPLTVMAKNYVAVADTPEGPFSFANEGKPFSNGIDMEYFIDDDGTPYAIHGSSLISIDQLEPDLLTKTGKSTKFEHGMGYVEGAFMFKRNDIYYFCGANLGYAEYRINYAMAKSPLGPFTVPEQPLIIEPIPQDHIWGTGHGQVIQLPNDEWLVIYLRSRMGESVDPFINGNVYRQVCADRFSFNPDGTIVPHGPTRKGVGLLAPNTSKGENLALGKKATASSYLKLYDPSKAVDGCNGTRWIISNGTDITPTAQTTPIDWKYTTEKPTDNWFDIDFDDSKWQTGKSGFGTEGTKNAIVNTTWNTPDIWIRREFDIKSKDLNNQIKLIINHDDDAKVYINGKDAATLFSYNAIYQQKEISEIALNSLKPGKNYIAIYCHQVEYGQFIDAGIVAMPKPWWQVDLGKISEIERTEISFNYPTEITPYTIEYSTDGKNWKLYADRTEDKIHESPKVDYKSVTARFLRVNFQHAMINSIPAGLWEFKAFNQK